VEDPPDAQSGPSPWRRLALRHPATSYRRSQGAVSPISTVISNEYQGIEQRVVVAVRPSPHRSRCGSPGDGPSPYVMDTTSIVECQEVVTNRAAFSGRQTWGISIEGGSGSS